MKILVVVQARVGSTRLPGKILKPVLGKSILARQLERIARAASPDKIITAAPAGKDDDIVQKISEEEGFECFRGHPDDLLDRHYKAAEEFGAGAVVKIPSDCPLICPEVIDKVINYFKDNSGRFDFVSNLHPPTYPDGNDVEVIPMSILESAWKVAKKKHEREHTTPFIWDRPERFRIGNVLWESGRDFSMSHRFTIDYQEDYEFIKAVYEELYPEKEGFLLDDILSLLERKPEVYKINSGYAGVNWYRENLSDLKTISPDKTKII